MKFCYAIQDRIFTFAMKGSCFFVLFFFVFLNAVCFKVWFLIYFLDLYFFAHQDHANYVSTLLLWKHSFICMKIKLNPLFFRSRRLWQTKAIELWVVHKLMSFSIVSPSSFENVPEKVIPYFFFFFSFNFF